MHVCIGERVYWGAPEVIYLEGKVTALNEQTQAVRMRIERATPNSAHLVGSELVFASDGIMPVRGGSPPGLADRRETARRTVKPMSDEEKVRSAAAALVYQRYGNDLATEQRADLIEQVVGILNSDTALRARIIASMDLMLARES